MVYCPRKKNEMNSQNNSELKLMGATINNLKKADNEYASIFKDGFEIKVYKDAPGYSKEKKKRSRVQLLRRHVKECKIKEKTRPSISEVSENLPDLRLDKLKDARVVYATTRLPERLRFIYTDGKEYEWPVFNILERDLDSLKKIIKKIDYRVRSIRASACTLFWELILTRRYGGFGALGYSVYTRELIPILDKPICHVSTSGTHTVAITESDAFDTEQLLLYVEKLKHGQAVNISKYDFRTYKTNVSKLEINPSDVILLEGILIFHDARVRDLMNMKIFVDTDADVLQRYP
ncbi:hypothetical protein POM88_053238 [Heracleum sosnowskyi]|uniref:Phosphoribulokinase/uridine kinase domain-containing protein n=1 Tax=Heracleum sosnowskyi TaxID=360622 RepID=A0AAD8GR27_9APIA|nr:hypothetical protein POM88_053238 [Heracleum sosnowskyi]